MQNLKSKILLKLQDLGWSDIIDSRWREVVIKDIKQYFPEASNEIIEEILNLVLI